MGSSPKNFKARTRSAETIFAMVESGLGLAIVTDALAKRAMLTHAVKRCVLTVPPYCLTTATVSEDSQSFALRSLLKFVSRRDLSSKSYSVSDLPSPGSQVAVCASPAQCDRIRQGATVG